MRSYVAGKSEAGMHGDDELGVEPVALILQAFRWFS